MSLSVTRRKSRRKLQHQPKNLDGVLFPTATANSANLPNDRSVSQHRRREDTSHRESRPKSRRHLHSLRSSPSPASISTTAPLTRSSLRKCNFLGKGGMPVLESELSLENISFRVGQINYEMDDLGNWSTSSKSCTDLKKSIEELNGRNSRMAQENNMLRVKNELLADMIARKNLRKEKIEKELERLRKLLSASSSRFANNSTVNKK